MENISETEDTSENDQDESKFQCPYCKEMFKHKKSLDRHVTWNCKQKEPPDPDIQTPSRRNQKLVPEVTELKVDKEIEGLLANINSDYTRWRLAQIMGVTQRSTYPILHNHHYPGSKSSFLTSCCPTREPDKVMVDVLNDAYETFNIKSVTMPKNIVVIDPNDGSKVDATKFIKPVYIGQYARSNRPKIQVEETEEHYVFSLEKNEECVDVEKLEESVQQMSLEASSLNLSVNSVNFAPMHESSPAPGRTLASVMKNFKTQVTPVAAGVEEQDDPCVVDDDGAIGAERDMSDLSDTPFHG